MYLKAYLHKACSEGLIAIQVNDINYLGTVYFPCQWVVQVKQKQQLLKTDSYHLLYYLLYMNLIKT